MKDMIESSRDLLTSDTSSVFNVDVILLALTLLTDGVTVHGKEDRIASLFAWFSYEKSDSCVS